MPNIILICVCVFFSSTEFFPACLLFFLSAGSVLGTGLVKTHSCGSGPGSHHVGNADKIIFLFSPTLLADRVTVQGPEPSISGRGLWLGRHSHALLVGVEIGTSFREGSLAGCTEGVKAVWNGVPA